VCFWFDRARESIELGMTERVGLVATNSIRGGANRRVLDAIEDSLGIFDAWSDQPWTVEGAAVRVSLVCFAKKDTMELRIDNRVVQVIHPDLTDGAANLTTARRLAENTGVSFIPPQKTGAFQIEGAAARAMLSQPANPNGRPNNDVVHPWVNGLAVVRRWPDLWIVDFVDRTEEEASQYIAPFAHVVRAVKPVRATNPRHHRRIRWWLHGETMPAMRRALGHVARYIATARVSKHRVFIWLSPAAMPDSAVVAIARDDDTTFGILQSRFHEHWALRMGTSLEDRPRYTPTTTFETFPFPEHLTPNLPAASYANNPHAQAIAAVARDLVEKRDLWLNPPDLIQRIPEVVPGYPDRIVPRDAKAAAILKTRTLTNLYNTRGTPEGTWLDTLHRELDEAVAAAYGWPADLPDHEVLACLLALNRARQPK
jgi:type II restriction/modification system DNA methylase subunit YeeA